MIVDRRPVVVGIATPSPLKRRVERVIAAEAGIRVVDLAAAERVDVAGVHGSAPEGVAIGLVVPMPVDPMGHLAELLAERAREAAGTERMDFVAVTESGSRLGEGTAVTFPPPVGPLWARPEGDRLVAPHHGDLAAVAVAATGVRGAVRLGVVDVHDFVAAIVLAAPVLAAVGGIDELAAAEAAGLDVAEFVTAA